MKCLFILYSKIYYIYVRLDALGTYFDFCVSQYKNTIGVFYLNLTSNDEPNEAAVR